MVALWLFWATAPCCLYALVLPRFPLPPPGVERPELLALLLLHSGTQRSPLGFRFGLFLLGASASRCMWSPSDPQQCTHRPWGVSGCFCTRSSHGLFPWPGARYCSSTATLLHSARSLGTCFPGVLRRVRRLCRLLSLSVLSGAPFSFLGCPPFCGWEPTSLCGSVAGPLAIQATCRLTG